jgi:HEAT repeat protein
MPGDPEIESKAVREIISLLAHANSEIRNNAWKQLRALGGSAAREVLAMIREGYFSRRSLWDYGNYIIRCIADEQAIPASSDALNDKNPTVREFTAAILGGTRNKIVFDLLFSLLNDPVIDVRHQVIRSLGHLIKRLGILGASTSKMLAQVKSVS